MNRKEARESLVKMFYEMSIHNDFGIVIKDQYIEKNTFQKQETYFLETYESIIANINRIDELIEQNLKNWHLETISKVDLAILRVAIAELCYNEDIPNSVSINEAIDIAKLFGGEESGKFVNGVLGKISKVIN